MVILLCSCGYREMTDPSQSTDDEMTETDPQYETDQENEDQNNLTAIDPFEGLSVEFDGISPFCTISFNNSRCTEEVQLNVVYSLDPYEISTEGNFTIDDEVTVYASLKDMDDSYTLSITEKTYRVENVPKYITELTSDMDLTLFKQEAEDYLISITSWSKGDYHVFGTTRGFFVSSSNLTKHDSYLSVLKLNNYNKFQNGDTGIFNKIDITYSVNIANTDSNSHLEGKEYVAGTYFNQYFTIQAVNIIQYPDGNIGWGATDPATLSFDHNISSTSIEDLININVNSIKADYNVDTVSNILE